MLRRSAWLYCKNAFGNPRTTAAARSYGSGPDRAQQDYYAILGVERTASPAVIKKHFFQRAKQVHPDAQPNSRSTSSDSSRGRQEAEAFVQLVLAYDCLSDPQQRAAYDAQLDVASRQAAAPSWARGAASGGSTSSSSSSNSWRGYGYSQQQQYQAGGGRASGWQAEDINSAELWDTSGDDPDRWLGGYPGILRRAKAAATFTRARSGGYGPDAAAHERDGTSSIWSALVHAHDGPAWRGAPRDWPYAFELELRDSPAASRDLAHLTVGAQPLGAVTVADVGAQQPVLELRYQGRLVASARMHERVPRSQSQQPQPQQQHADDDEEAEVVFGKYLTIYRHYEDGSHGPPLAHVLSSSFTVQTASEAAAAAAGGRGAPLPLPRPFRTLRIVSCDLVNPHSHLPKQSGRTSAAYEQQRQQEAASQPQPQSWLQQILGEQPEDGQQQDRHRHGKPRAVHSAPTTTAYGVTGAASISSATVTTAQQQMAEEEVDDRELFAVRRHSHRGQHERSEYTARAMRTRSKRDEWNVLGGSGYDGDEGEAGGNNGWWSAGSARAGAGAGAGAGAPAEMPRMRSSAAAYATWRDTILGAGNSYEAEAAAEEGDAYSWEWRKPPAAAAGASDTTDTAGTAGASGASVSHDVAYVHPSQATHTLLLIHTPGMLTARFVRHRGAVTETSCSRRLLPPAALWMWQPRSAAHTRSAWALELARRRKKEAALHPAVYALACAALSLEGELELEQEAAEAEAEEEQAVEGRPQAAHKGRGTRGSSGHAPTWSLR